MTLVPLSMRTVLSAAHLLKWGASVIVAPPTTSRETAATVPSVIVYSTHQLFAPEPCCHEGFHCASHVWVHS
jgi:hypothetical protein